MKDRLINMIKIFFLYTVRLLLQYIPLRAVHFLGDMVGGVFIGKKAQFMKEDLKMLLGNIPEAELDKIIKRTMQNFRKDLLEIWLFPKLNKKKIDKMAYFEGIEHLDNALAKGKGAMLCITHFGSWKIVLPALGYNGYTVNQIAANPLVFVRDNEMHYHNKIMKLELESEESLPVNFIYVNERKSIRPVHRALSNNETVIISLDGVIGGKRMTLPFLNGQIVLSTGGGTLAYNTGAPALPIFIVRDKNNRHKMIIHEPFDIDKKIGKEEYIERWMQSYTKLFENYVKQYPDHYARFLYTIRKYPISNVGEIIQSRGSKDMTSLKRSSS